MLISQKREHYQFVVDTLREFEGMLTEWVQLVSQIRPVKARVFYKILDGKSLNSDIEAGQLFIQSIKDFKQKFNPFDFVLDCTELESVLRGYVDKERIELPELFELFEYLLAFKGSLQKFYKNDNRVNMIELYIIGEDLCAELTDVIDRYSWFIENSKTDIVELEENETVLDIQLLGVDFSVEEFARRIQLMSEIYEEVSTLVNIDHKMKIVKIESGSLACQVIANIEVAEIIASVLTAMTIEMIDYYRQNRKMMPKKERGNIADTKLAEELEKHGVSKKAGIQEQCGRFRKRSIEFTSCVFKFKFNETEISYPVANEDDYKKLMEQALLEGTPESTDE